MTATPRLLAELAVVFLLIAPGCGGDDQDEVATATTISSTATAQPTTTADPTTRSTSSSTSPQPTTTLQSTTNEAVSTSLSITVDFVCGSGESGTVDVPTNDIEQIDQIVNTIDLCEFRGGLARISFVAPCPGGDREVTVAAENGEVPDIATLDLCEGA